jgi:hypothetical protein
VKGLQFHLVQIAAAAIHHLFATMNIHKFKAEFLLAKCGVPVTAGHAAMTADKGNAALKTMVEVQSQTRKAFSTSSIRPIVRG